ncbi:hypothetical protein GEMRC1_006499 [Eukaryota sp. GEM-RC1]
MSDEWGDEEQTEFATLGVAPTKQQEDSDIPDDWDMDSDEDEEASQNVTQEEISDYQATRSLFSGQGERAQGDPTDLNNFHPVSADDFDLLGKAIGKRMLTYYKDALNFDALLKQVISTAVSPMDSESTRRVSAYVSTIANEKLAVEKAAKGGKKKKSKKPAMLKDRGLKTAVDVLDDFEEDVDFDDEYDGFM